MCRSLLSILNWIVLPTPILLSNIGSTIKSTNFSESCTKNLTDWKITFDFCLRLLLTAVLIGTSSASGRISSALVVKPSLGKVAYLPKFPLASVILKSASIWMEVALNWDRMAVLNESATWQLRLI